MDMRVGAIEHDSSHMYTRYKQYKVLLVSSELGEFVKVGGLGDITSSFPRGMKGEMDVRVLIPGYREVIDSTFPRERLGTLPGFADIPACELYRFTLDDGLVVYVLKHPMLYERDGTPYMDNGGHDWYDNHVRFARLSLAAAQMVAELHDQYWKPDILHLNDWPTALAAGYVRWLRIPVATVFVIHNLAHQGIFPLECAAALGIPAEAINSEQMEYYGQLSLLKAGLVYAHRLIAVSSTYAKEILAEGKGNGLDGVLRRRAAQGQLEGIVNGIGLEWSPSQDAFLQQPFSMGQWEKRKVNRDYILHTCGLEPGSGPIFSMISRLVHQKGIDFVIDTVTSILDKGGKLIIMGRGNPGIEQALSQLEAQYRHRLCAYIGFDERLAHNIFAGSDFLLMPSRFEPCGLSQMYAQCYGTIPIAYRTGGLSDTIEANVSGILFDQLNAGELVRAIDHAFEIYHNPARLNDMRCEGMKRDFSWHHSSREYLHAYLDAISDSETGLVAL